MTNPASSLQPAPAPAIDGPKVYRCGTLTYTTRGLIVLFAWMLWGDFCFTLMEAVVPSILPLKLRSLDSPNMVIGFIMTTLPAMFNFTITPVLSFKSDRHRGKWGRRLPFILATMPFLALSLILIGFSDSIGAWVFKRFFEGGAIGQTQVVIVLLAVFAALFDLFNMFVNTVYWYLFADVVPVEWMGRFTAWFRIVGTATSALYNLFIFKYAGTHMQEIFLGAAFLYLFGFGIMCFRVKEGRYPAPEEGAEQASFLANVKVFAKECFSTRYYWYIFLTYAVACIGGGVGVFGIFFLKSLGLSLDQMGKMWAIPSFAAPVCLIFAGNLVDKWHPVRVTAYGAAWGLFFGELGNATWLFIDKPSPELFIWIAVGCGIISAPFGAVTGTAGGPRLMLLFPKDQYGQFSGAMALVRACALLVSGLLAGCYLDLLKRFVPGDFVYRFCFLWTVPFAALAFYFHYRTYRAWKRLGGAKHYVAPSAPVRFSELKPYPGDDGRVETKFLWLAALCFLGGEIANLVWIGYYIWFNYNPHNAVVFGAKAALDAVMFLGFLRFIKFMERP